jgi:hypothetical protein
MQTTKRCENLHLTQGRAKPGMRFAPKYKHPTIQGISCSSSVSTVVGYRLDDNRDSIPGTEGDFSLRYCIQTGYRSHTILTMGIMHLSPETKRFGHSPTSSKGKVVPVLN